MPSRRAPGEGAIYRTATGWRGSLSLGYLRDKRIRRYVSGKTRREVADKLARLKQETDGQELTGPITLATYLRRWHRVTAPALRPATADRYRNLIEQSIIPALGAKRLDRLRRRDVQAWVESVPGAPRTVRNHYAVLRCALNAGVRTGTLTKNVAEYVTLPRSETPAVTPLSASQTRAFLCEAQEDRLACLWLTAALLGLRSGEVRGLRWEDIDDHALVVRGQIQRVRGAYVWMEPKTARGRRLLPLSDDLMTAFAAHRERQAAERMDAGVFYVGNSWDLCFTTARGEPFGASVLTRRFQRLLTDAGLPHKRFHDLRHGAASLLLAERHPLAYVSMALGHASIGVTNDTYGHLDAAAHRTAFEGVSARLLGETSKAATVAAIADGEVIEP